jgi:membrane-associated phospholipid phosphatase
MKLWERIFFALSSLCVLATIGIKLHELDMPVARFVRSFDIHVLNRIGDFVALAGKGEVLAGIFLLIGLFGWWRKREGLRELGIRGLIAMAGVGAVSQFLKHLIGRPRPRFAHGDEFALGSSLGSGFDSFPSGHAINTFGAAAVVAWLVPTLRVPMYMMAGLVGLSRVVRGSHFPTDVFAGAVLGVVIGSLAAAGFRRWREVLPGLLRTGVPIAVIVFLVVWVIFHPTGRWSGDMAYLVGGLGLVLAGGLLRGLAVASEGDRGGFLRNAGSLSLILGVAVATGPWWVSLMLLVSLMPVTLALGLGKAPTVRGAPLWRRLPAGGQGALAVGAALLMIAGIRFVSGLIPLV